MGDEKAVTSDSRCAVLSLTEFCLLSRIGFKSRLYHQSHFQLHVFPDSLPHSPGPTLHPFPPDKPNNHGSKRTTPQAQQREEPASPGDIE